jgi:organic hydroperoxide reductase OsmC/OhrA
MVEYPVSFSSESETGKKEEKWSVKTGEGLETEMSVPEEFGGDSENPSPEDLFNASLSACIIATFKITAERKGLEFSNVELDSETFLDRNEEGRPVMKNAEIVVEVYGTKDEKLGEEVAQITERNCFIHNSVKTDVDTKFNFH